MNTLDALLLTLSSRQAANALLETAGKSFLILAAAFLLALWFRRSAAATRHFIWLGAMASLLALPVAVVVTPRWSRPAWTDALLRHATAQVSGNEVPTLMTGLPAQSARANPPPRRRAPSPRRRWRRRLRWRELFPGAN